MGNVNMEADQIHVRDNEHKTWRTVADALKALEASGESVAEDITELYTRDASRASKVDIAGEFSAEQAYYVGDYVYYQGSLFEFTAFHAAGAWNPEDVALAQIGPDIVMLKAHQGIENRVYSTTPQDIGLWTDGVTKVKRVVINLSSATTFKYNDWAQIPLSGSDYSLILNACAIGSDGSYCPLILGRDSANTVALACRVDSNFVGNMVIVEYVAPIAP